MMRGLSANEGGLLGKDRLRFGVFFILEMNREKVGGEVQRERKWERR